MYYGLCYTSYGALAEKKKFNESTMRARSNDPLHHELHLTPKLSAKTQCFTDGVCWGLITYRPHLKQNLVPLGYDFMSS